MDKLIMNINDYKSINQANIEINKLNVVSGFNGSGKSTLSRILYSFLKGNSTKRKEYLLEKICDDFNRIVDILSQDFFDYDLPDFFKVSDTEEEILEKVYSLFEITEKHEKICEPKIEELDKKISDEFDATVEKLKNKGFINNIDELNDDEKEVMDTFRKMKLLYDHSRFRLHKYQIEDLINDYEQLKKLRKEIQVKYFSIYEELLAEDLIEGELDASIWGIAREHENEIWDSEIRLMSDIKREFDVGIAMIESGEAEQAIIDDENS